MINIMSDSICKRMCLQIEKCFAHLKLRLRCSNGEFKKESESRVDHQAGILNTEYYEFLFISEVSSKLTANATVVSCWVSVSKR